MFSEGQGATAVPFLEKKRQDGGERFGRGRKNPVQTKLATGRPPHSSVPSSQLQVADHYRVFPDAAR